MGHTESKSQKLLRRRAQNKRVLAVQAMVGETAWLEGHLRWQDGRVVWESARGPLAPSGADIALAQRRLYQIARYPRVAAAVLGNLAAWRQRRQARLALVKQLYRLAAPDLPALGAHPDDPATIARLVALLPAEALCVNTLPVSPAAALLAAGAPARPGLAALLADTEAPPAGRALAALVLGADARRHGTPPVALPSDNAWCHRAYLLSTQIGLPAEAPLLVALLAADDGAALARRYRAAVAAPGPLRLPGEMLRGLLADGAAPDRVVRLAEAMIPAGAVAAQMVQCRDLPPMRDPDLRRDLARDLRAARQAVADAWANLLLAYAQATTDPAVILDLAHISQAVITLAPVTWLPSGRGRQRHPADSSPGWASGDALLAALERGQDLPPPLYTPYLALLVSEQDQLWPPADRPPATDPPQVATWLATCQRQQIDPLVKLLAQTGDPGLVRAAIRQGIYKTLAQYDWHDPALCRWALRLIGDFYQEARAPGDDLCALLSHFAHLTEARTRLGPIFAALGRAPRSTRPQWLNAIRYELPARQVERRAGLVHLAHHLPRLIAFAGANPDADDLEVLVAAALAVDESTGDEADAGLAWLLARISAGRQKAALTYRERASLRLGLLLGRMLAGGHRAHWQVILETIFDHDYGHQIYLVEQSAPVLARYPAVQAMFARLFPRHPTRCLELLARVGAAAHLDPAVFDPLAEIVAVAADDAAAALPPEWAPLGALAPDLQPTVRDYLRARHLLSG